MIHRISTGLAGMFVAGLSLAAESAQTPRFAAPEVAASIPAGSAGGIGQVSFALLLVLAAVFGVAWLVRRLRAVTGAGPHGIEVLAQTSLGAKERAVIVRVGESRLLLGVASGQVTLLQTLPREDFPPAVPPAHQGGQRPGFGDLLKKSIGR